MTRASNRPAGPGGRPRRAGEPAASESADPSAPTQEISRPGDRRSLFTVGMVLLPFLFFALLEGGLRLAGYGEVYPLFVDLPGSGEWRTQNREVARRYFSKQDVVPTPLGDAFRAGKDSTTFRIVVQGGSSAAGYPYYYGGSFSRMLAQRLQQTYPDRRIEVINTAMAAVNSYTLLDFAGEIVDIDPDAVLIYAGHNEYYGALGVGSTESAGRFRGLVNLYLRLQEWRTVQLLRAALSGVAGWFAPGSSEGPPGRTLMERMVAEQRIPISSPLFRMGEAQFEGNLEALLATYGEAGIPVYVSTLASNERDHAPFESAPGEGTNPGDWASALRRVDRWTERGDTLRALALLDSLVRIDTIDASVHYLKARLLDALGRPTEALPEYVAAKDRDQLRFRAPESFNDIIRRVASRTGATVVDGQAALRAAAPGSIIDSSLMLEHLHPNLDGYFLLADAFYERLLADTLIGAPDTVVPDSAARRELLVTAVDSLFGALRLRQLLGSWPFKPAGTFDASLDTLTARSTAEDLALRVHRDELSWYEATDRLRQAYAQVGDHHRALRAALAMIQQYPFLPAPYAYAGEAMLRQQRAAEALAYYQAAVDIEESAVVRAVMGDIHSAVGADAKAAVEYERAVALLPEDAELTLKLGRALAVTGRFDESAAVLERFLQRKPGDERVSKALEALRAHMGS